MRQTFYGAKFEYDILRVVDNVLLFLVLRQMLTVAKKDGKRGCRSYR